MLKILEITFPFFALVLCGFVFARLRWLPLDAIPGLNVFVLFFALPCMLFRFGAATPIARMLDPVVFGAYLFCSTLMVGLAVAITRRGATGWNDAAFGALVATFPNSGFIGVPLLVKLMGEGAAAPAILALAVDMVITTSLCIALSRMASGPGNDARRAVGNAMKGMATNPLPWAIALGCAASALGLDLPLFLSRPVGMLGDAASPVALFTLGAMLARTQLQVPQLHATTGAVQAMPARLQSDVMLIVACKLLLHPLLVLGVGRALMSGGVRLDNFTVTVLALLAALPSASNVPMLAERYGADSGRIARIVFVSTVLAFASFTAAVACLL